MKLDRFTSEDPVLENSFYAYPINSLSCHSCLFSQSIPPGMKDFPHNRRIFPQELNRYLYVADNPLNFLDVDGLDRYRMCEDLDIIRKWICRNIIVPVSCFFNNLVCCQADMANCIANLLGKSYPEAEQKRDELLECPENIPEPLLECYKKYLQCLGGGNPQPPTVPSR